MQKKQPETILHMKNLGKEEEPEVSSSDMKANLLQDNWEGFNIHSSNKASPIPKSIIKEEVHFLEDQSFERELVGNNSVSSTTKGRTVLFKESEEDVCIIFEKKVGNNNWESEKEEIKYGKIGQEKGNHISRLEDSTPVNGLKKTHTSSELNIEETPLLHVTTPPPFQNHENKSDMLDLNQMNVKLAGSTSASPGGLQPTGLSKNNQSSKISCNKSTNEVFYGDRALAELEYEDNVEEDFAQSDSEKESRTSNQSLFESEKEEISGSESSPIISTDILQMIAKAMFTPKGYVTEQEIETIIVENVPCIDKKSGFLKKIIKSTLKNNSDVFLPHAVIKEDKTVETGFWTLHPMAAVKFAQNTFMKQIPFEKENCGTTQRNCNTNDEKLIKTPVVKLKRLSTVECWTSKIPEDQIPTMTTSSYVASSLSKFGIHLETKWSGWRESDEAQNPLQDKIAKLGKIIESLNNVSPPSSSPKRGAKEKSVQLERKGKRGTCQDNSCSEPESSDDEMPADDSIVHNEHNYVANEKISSGSKNLIEKLSKIVKTMDKDKKLISNKNKVKPHHPGSDIEENGKEFFGLNYDYPSGNWRGWETVSTKNARKMKRILRREEGNRDLVEVLEESNMAVTKVVEALERDSPHKKENSLNQPCHDDTAVQGSLEELMTRYDGMQEEPPVSYLVMVTMAFCSTPERALTVQEICDFIQNHFPYHARSELNLESVIEKILELNSPTTFHKCRRPANTIPCWKRDISSACGILSRALQSGMVRDQPTKIPIKKPIEDLLASNNSAPNKNATEKSESPFRTEQKVRKSRPGVIVDTNSSKSLSKSNDFFNDKKQEIPSTIHQNHLVQEICRYPKADHSEITDLGSSAKQISKRNADENKTFEELHESVVGASVPVIFGDHSFCDQSNNKPNITSQHSAKNNIELVGKINVIKSRCNSPLNYIEDEKSEFIDIDTCLQDKENSNFSCEEDHVVDEDIEKVWNNSSHGYELFGKEQHSKKNETGSETCDSTLNCWFLLRCHDMDPELKQYPCYVCHKFFYSREVLSFHFAQNHFGKDNIHATSALCQSRKRKGKIQSTRGPKKLVLISPENSCGLETIGPRSNETLVVDCESKESQGVIRYRCSECPAVFHKEDVLEFHNFRYHNKRS